MPHGTSGRAILVNRPVVGFLTQDEIDALDGAHKRRVRVAVLDWSEMDVIAVEDLFDNNDNTKFVGIRPAGVKVDDDEVRDVIGEDIGWFRGPLSDPRDSTQH